MGWKNPFVYVLRSTMATDSRAPHGPQPQRLVVTSPSGLPVSGWAWFPLDGDADVDGVVLSRMTLRPSGDDWVRAEGQEPLDRGATDFSSPAGGSAPRTLVMLPDSDTVVSGPIAHDAEVTSSALDARTTRLRGGRVTLIGTGPSGTHRTNLEIVALRRVGPLGHIALDLRASFRWPDARRMRFLIAIDDASHIEDREGTLTTPGERPAEALPFRGSAPSEPTGRVSSTIGLPFQDEARRSAPPTVGPGETRSMPALGGSRGPLVTPLAVPPPPRVVVPAVHPESALEASNRASGEQVGAAAVGAPRAKAATARGVELLWFEPEVGDRLRAQPAWRKLLRDAESDERPHDELPSEPTASVESRRAVLEILRRAKPESASAWRGLLADAFVPRGAFRAPLTVGTGELAVVFEELATLRAHCAATKASVRSHPAFEPVWQECSALAAAADPLTPVVDLEEATASLRAAFAETGAFSLEELTARVEGALVARRCFKAVELHGDLHVRTRFTSRDGASATVYLPADCAREWPLARALSVDVIVSVVPPQELGSGEPCAGYVVALARHAPCLEEGTD